MAATHHFSSELQVGSQAIARELVKRGWEVIYLSAPITPLHLLSLGNPGVRARISLALQRGKTFFDGQLHSYIPASLVAPDGRFLLREKFVIDTWYRTRLRRTCPDLEQLQDRVSLLYIDNLAYLDLCRKIPAKTKIFRVMDNHDRFRGWNGRGRKIAARIAKACDITIYSSDGLKNYVASLNPMHAKCVPNAVDAERLRNYPSHQLPASLSYKDPYVLYLGAIDDRLDLNLLARVASRLPECRFVIAGPVMTGLPRRPPDNLEFIGPVGRSLACALMRNAKAGLVPFKAPSGRRQLTGIRPIKMLEYMAMGLPVISASWPDVESDDLPIYRYKSEETLLSLTRQAVGAGLEGKAGETYAQRHSWKNAVDDMLH